MCVSTEILFELLCKYYFGCSRNNIDMLKTCGSIPALNLVIWFFLQRNYYSTDKERIDEE